ncbi:synaptophysin-like [Oscarella lobularis]|uniref:synaptophysin-like n=1 Tax=Oscarella lobularis TaxID=121494 RepID=UPI0033141CC7
MDRLDVFKEPRGFLKILEFVFAIAAFATLTSYHSSGRVERDYSISIRNFSENGTNVYNFVIGYDFGDDDLYFESEQGGGGNRIFVVRGRHRAHANFFLFVGIFAFLASIFVVACYVFVEEKLAAQSKQRRDLFFKIDFGLTILIAFFWFVAGCVWAAAANSLPGVVDKGFADFIASEASSCQSRPPFESVVCLSTKPTYGGVIVAVILAYLNFFLWAGNSWFAFKEIRDAQEVATATTPATMPSHPTAGKSESQPHSHDDDDDDESRPI